LAATLNLPAMNSGESKGFLGGRPTGCWGFKNRLRGKFQGAGKNGALAPVQKKKGWCPPKSWGQRETMWTKPGASSGPEGDLERIIKSGGVEPLRACGEHLKQRGGGSRGEQSTKQNKKKKDRVRHQDVNPGKRVVGWCTRGCWDKKLRWRAWVFLR